jgi:hypothetical protein
VRGRHCALRARAAPDALDLRPCRDGMDMHRIAVAFSMT